MNVVEPKIFLIGESSVIEAGVNAFLAEIGAPEWHSDAGSSVEMFPEFYGRLCYRSFAPGLNPNVTKIREGNQPYLANILKVGHGSVLEHSTLNFVFSNVSRVFTHELVRHRPGVAISQESLRYVRLDELAGWIPPEFSEDEYPNGLFIEVFEHLEAVQGKLAEYFKLDDSEMAFHIKKQITSAMRRLAPIGLATTIGWSTNIRTLRHVLAMRTDPAAEIEIRIVFAEVGRIVMERYPNLFQDFKVEDHNGIGWYKPANTKV